MNPHTLYIWGSSRGGEHVHTHSCVNDGAECWCGEPTPESIREMQAEARRARVADEAALRAHLLRMDEP